MIKAGNFSGNPEYYRTGSFRFASRTFSDRFGILALLVPSALRAKLEAAEAELDRLFENSGRQPEAAAEASGIFEALMQQ